MDSRYHLPLCDQVDETVHLPSEIAVLELQRKVVSFDLTIFLSAKYNGRVEGVLGFHTHKGE